MDELLDVSGGESKVRWTKFVDINTNDACFRSGNFQFLSSSFCGWRIVLLLACRCRTLSGYHYCPTQQVTHSQGTGGQVPCRELKVKTTSLRVYPCLEQCMGMHRSQASLCPRSETPAPGGAFSWVGPCVASVCRPRGWLRPHASRGVPLHGEPARPPVPRGGPRPPRRPALPLALPPAPIVPLRLHQRCVTLHRNLVLQHLEKLHVLCSPPMPPL